MATIAVTGSASGIGAATVDVLRHAGHEVIGVDRADGDVVADLGTSAGRATAVAAVVERCNGSLDGLVTCAGLGPIPERPGSSIVSVNHFGTVELLAGLRPALGQAAAPAAVAISSNSTTTTPGVPDDLIDLCLAGDEAAARARADALGAMAGVYPASKIAVARWVRRHAVTDEWIGAGIRLNAVAPGVVDTAMVAEAAAHADVGPLIEMFPIPMQRAAAPSEIAAFIAFLLGPDARAFCGSVLFVDGGTEAQLRPDAWPAPWDLDLQALAEAFGNGRA
jgi:NAD(P)-dependent dehydrogenase (short-subunit alcohol dehydrogenase family)